MRIDLQTDEILAFLAVAEKSSFKAAAEELFVSQPALSRRIERLESALGSQLFERTTRRVSLTQAGRQFLPHAQAAMEELELAIRGISETSIQRGGMVTLACVPTVANHLVPSVLKEFAAKFPKARVKVIDEGAAQVLESVVAGIADFGINFIGAQESDIEFEGVYQENFVLAVPRRHSLARQASVSWDELAEESFISVGGTSGNRTLIDHALAKLKKRPAIRYEANHIAGAMGLVAAGLGVAAVPSLALFGDAYPTLTGLPLTGPRISRTIGLIHRKGSKLHPTAQALFGMVKKAMSSRKPKPAAGH
ncbi:transcriptional regulator, LysR family [Noviherbaspirillum humi]|uniref:Transcriptional regulator, LysR family n=1 Tax=Noviherbaspirillum humi TaxID=1688639 RepID=A0A239LZ95_9BURK|nr:LysR family transcriptional regulator [Noviherbaspirillum humi]SNT35302.1 transcriptional regulator, LysR family [Noviherbaspirillum humi]